jgi:MoxR-like ATPase
MTTNLPEASAKLRSAVTAAARGLVDREPLVELVALSAVAREHLLVIGPPGTAKSVAVRRIAQATGGRYFEYLLGRFTEPNEIFGPVDLRKLHEGTVETDVSGMLPEAEIAFLDEIFQGSSAILNTLLGILNERVFRRGHTQLTCPMRICVRSAKQFADR